MTEFNYNFKILTDDTERKLGNYPKPTRLNMIGELNNLVKNKGNLFLHYSGHGSYTRDNNNDEKDGKDELLISTDHRGIRDDELNQILTKCDKDDKVFILVDA